MSTTTLFGKISVGLCISSTAVLLKLWPCVRLYPQESCQKTSRALCVHNSEMTEDPGQPFKNNVPDKSVSRRLNYMSLSWLLLVVVVVLLVVNSSSALSPREGERRLGQRDQDVRDGPGVRLSVCHTRYMRVICMCMYVYVYIYICIYIYIYTHMYTIYLNIYT